MLIGQVVFLNTDRIFPYKGSVPQFLLHLHSCPQLPSSFLPAILNPQVSPSFFFFKTFLTWTIFKVFLNLLQYCFCFMFCFFGHEARGILAPSPTKGQTCTPRTGRWSLDHCTSREVRPMGSFSKERKDTYWMCTRERRRGRRQTW